MDDIRLNRTLIIPIPSTPTPPIPTSCPVCNSILKDAKGNNSYRTLECPRSFGEHSFRLYIYNEGPDQGIQIDLERFKFKITYWINVYQYRLVNIRLNDQIMFHGQSDFDWSKIITDYPAVQRKLSIWRTFEWTRQPFVRSATNRSKKSKNDISVAPNHTDPEPIASTWLITYIRNSPITLNDSSICYTWMDSLFNIGSVNSGSRESWFVNPTRPIPYSIPITMELQISTGPELQRISTRSERN